MATLGAASSPIVLLGLCACLLLLPSLAYAQSYTYYSYYDCTYACTPYCASDIYSPSCTCYPACTGCLGSWYWRCYTKFTTTYTSPYLYLYCACYLTWWEWLFIAIAILLCVLAVVYCIYSGMQRRKAEQEMNENSAMYTDQSQMPPPGAPPPGYPPGYPGAPPPGYPPAGQAPPPAVVV